MPMTEYFTYESRDTLKSFCLSLRYQTFPETEYGTQRKLRNINLKIFRRGWRSTGNAEFGHFTLLFSRGRQRNVQRFTTLVQSCCFAHKPFV